MPSFAQSCELMCADHAPMLVTLLHGPRQAMAIPKTTAEWHDARPWLDNLRNFKGQATPTPDTRHPTPDTTRIIDGHTVHGWTPAGLRVRLVFTAKTRPDRSGRVFKLIDVSRI